jgi:NhaP-type Na+/H+ or K+/H+ antiporter
MSIIALILLLFMATAGLRLLADRTGVPLPSLLVLGGLCVALIPGPPWALCFVLGAIVSPPDAVAVTASTRRLKLPRDLLVILEGESLGNDATALLALVP